MLNLINNNYHIFHNFLILCHIFIIDRSGRGLSHIIRAYFAFMTTRMFHKSHNNNNGAQQNSSLAEKQPAADNPQAWPDAEVSLQLHWNRCCRGELCSWCAYQ